VVEGVLVGSGVSAVSEVSLVFFSRGVWVLRFSVIDWGFSRLGAVGLAFPPGSCREYVDILSSSFSLVSDRSIYTSTS